MTRTAWVCAVAAALYGWGALAAAQGTPQERRGSQAERSKAETVTLTGCLQADENKSTFWLSDATTGGAQKGTSASGTAGTSGSASGTSAGRVEEMKSTAASETYRLNATGNVGLQAHVGHKVQITGTLATTAGTSGEAARTPSAGTERPPSSGTGATTPPSGRMGAHMSDVEKAPRVNVTAVKHISPVCEPGKQ